MPSAGVVDEHEKRLYDRDLFGDPIIPPKTGPLAERFLIPPFSVFDTRAGYWQDRKRAWVALGLKSELGRDDAVLMGTGQNSLNAIMGGNFQGVSIFDPVLCECLYRWFCPVGGQIIDPFAGGSVRGIVAALMGRRYWGCDLRAEQVAANFLQAEGIVTAPPAPAWVCGDSLSELDKAPAADFIMSCPPYGDLEKYSDDPKDLSTMKWEHFFDKYQAIITAACAKLKPGRFACFVVGNFRSPDGHYRDLVGTTSAMFQAAGLGYYNEGILVNPTGTLPVRVSSQFDRNRKLGKTHQNILLFVKGSWREAVEACLKNEKSVDDGTAELFDLTSVE